MMFYHIGLFMCLFVLHHSLASLNNDDSDRVETFQLTVTPAQVNRHTTDKMALRCERNPKVKTEMHQIFTMKIVKQSKTGWSVVAEQKIEETSPRVEGGVTASSQLMGDISSVFLQVNWDTIGSDNFGKFMCDVAGVDAQYNFVNGHSSEIDIQESKIPKDYFVLLLKKTNKMAEELNETIQTEIPSLKKGLEDLGISTENKLETLDESTDRKLKSLDESTETKIKSLEESTDTKITALDDEVSSTERKLKSLDDSTNTRFTTLDDEVSSTEIKLKSLDDSTNTRFTTLDGDVSSTEIKLKSLDDSTNTRITTLNDDMSSTKRKLENLDDSTDKRITTLDGEMSSTERKLKSLDDSTDKRITTLDGEMSSTEKRLETLELFLGGLTQWPRGFYALLQPKTGCPVDLAFFGGTHKFHKIHTEGGDYHTSALARHVAFKSDSNYFITLEFCEVTKQFNTESWPQGSFCVHKQIHKSCPAGFTKGYVKFDSKDGSAAVAEARNNVADELHNPQLYFCCQDSGPASVPIQLPTSSPFLLYRHGGVCQAVQGMSVSEEYLKVDTENDSNYDSVSDSHPDVEMGDSTIKFHLCYYTNL